MQNSEIMGSPIIKFNKKRHSSKLHQSLSSSGESTKDVQESKVKSNRVVSPIISYSERKHSSNSNIKKRKKVEKKSFSNEITDDINNLKSTIKNNNNEIKKNSTSSDNIIEYTQNTELNSQVLNIKRRKNKMKPIRVVSPIISYSERKPSATKKRKKMSILKDERKSCSDESADDINNLRSTIKNSNDEIIKNLSTSSDNTIEDTQNTELNSQVLNIKRRENKMKPNRVVSPIISYSERKPSATKKRKKMSILKDERKSCSDESADDINNLRSTIKNSNDEIIKNLSTSSDNTIEDTQNTESNSQILKIKRKIKKIKSNKVALPTISSSKKKSLNDSTDNIDNFESTNKKINDELEENLSTSSEKTINDTENVELTNKTKESERSQVLNDRKRKSNSSSDVSITDEKIVHAEIDINKDNILLSDDDCESLNEDTQNKEMIDKVKSSKDSSNNFIQNLHLQMIEVTWPLPELHQKSTHTVRLIERKLRKKFKKQGITMKTGRFTPFEDSIIEKNWKKMIKKYKLPDVPEALANWRNKYNDSSLAKTRRIAILYLARGLDNRTPSQVFQRFVHMFGSSVKGRFSEIDTAMLEAFLESNEMCTQQQLASILGRDERSIYRRLKILKKIDDDKKNYRKVPWKIDKVQNYLKHLLFIVTGETSVTEKNVEYLRDETITSSHWKKISEELNLSIPTVKNQWNYKLYNQLFSKEKIFSRDILSKLVKILDDKNYQYWSEINWSTVSEEFSYLKSLFLWRLLYDEIRRHSPHTISNFKESLQALKEKLVNNEIKQYKLKRLQVVNGHLFFYE